MAEPMTTDEPLDEERAAELLGMSQSTLYRLRRSNMAPPHWRSGTSSRAPVRYDRDALVQWRRQQRGVTQ